MTGKANVKKSVIDDIIKLKRQEAKSFGLARQSVSGVGSVSVIGASGEKGGSDNNENTALGLKTEGGTMIGPIAFYPTVTSIVSGVLDVGIDTLTPANAYSSRVICLGGATSGASIDINTIAGAAYAGQMLYLQAVATTFLTLKHGTGNIFSPTGADVEFSNKEIITLQFDSTSGTVGGDWIVSSSITGGGTVSGLLASNNVWTGTNSFTGSTFSSSATTSTSITSPQIYLGDQASDTINITGAVNVNGDIDMNTYDIFAVDRVKFSTTAGSGTALTSTDTGIEALYSAGVPYGMLIQFPSASSAIMQIKRGTTDMINISSLGILLGDELLMGGFKISNMADPTAAQDAATKAYVDASAGTGFANTSLSNLVSASVSINADLIPDISDARNIGGSTKYWGSAFISGRMYFDTGTSKFIDGTTTGTIELQVPSGGQVIFSEAGTDFYTMDGGSNTNTFSRDLWLTSGKAIRASSGVEVGYFVTNTTASVGSRGSVQIPTANQGVTTAAAADSVFGSEVGCCGMFTISGGQALAVKITSTTWQILQLGVAGSTALPYQI